MGNSLKMADKQRILALLELGWSYRRIQRETGVSLTRIYEPPITTVIDPPGAGSLKL